MSRLVVFDRDGTLIDFYRDPDLGVVTPAFHPTHVRWLPGALEAMRTLRDRGYLLAIASNQPGAAKGELPRSAIEATMDAVLERLEREGIAIAGVETCLHHPTGGERGDATLVFDCSCRKPKPGMLLSLATKLSILPGRAWMVGDTPTDVAAGAAGGMKTALLSPTRRCELCPLKDAPPLGTPKPDVHAPTLADVARAILSADDP